MNTYEFVYPNSIWTGVNVLETDVNNSITLREITVKKTMSK